MTSFLDGPAAGQCLMLRRAPYYLRVVTTGGKFDALDQIGDAPQPSEDIHVYEITGKPSSVHLNTGRKPGGGWFTVAKYRHCKSQPDNHTARDTEAWKQWCREQAALSQQKPQV